MIAHLSLQNSRTVIDIDGTVFAPLSFKSFRPTQRNISDFYKAGIKLFNILSTGTNTMIGLPYSLYGESWIGPREYDFDAIDRQIDFFIENAPDAYFSLMLSLDTRAWWLASHTDYPDSYWNLSQMCADTEWRELASAYLCAALIHAEQKYGDRMYGYYILCGTTTEWFSDRDYETPHHIKENAYRDHTRDSTASIPPESIRETDRAVTYLHPVTDVNLIRYRRFHANLIADTILYFAAEAQRVLEHKKLLGIYYGYLYELGDPRLWNAGSLAFMKVYNSPDIDIIASPSSYSYRAIDSVSAVMVPAGSINSREKLYWLEFDHRTPFSPSSETGIQIPGWESGYKTVDETIDAMRRDMMLTLANGIGFWWFDMFEGWFYSDTLMEEIRREIGIFEMLYKSESKNTAEIAFVTDAESLFLINKNAGVAREYFSAQRLELSLTGAPYDLLCTEDLASISGERYKLLIIAGLFKTDPSILSELNRLKSSGVSLLWLGAAGYIGSDRLDVSGIRTATGLDICTCNGKRDSVTFSDSNTYTIHGRDPSFYCANGDALAFYTGTHEAAAVRSGNTYWYAAGNAPREMLRRIAREAGVFIYNDRDDQAVYVRSDIIGIFIRTGNSAIIEVPENGDYSDLFTGHIYHAENNKITVYRSPSRAILLKKQ